MIRSPDDLKKLQADAYDIVRSDRGVGNVIRGVDRGHDTLASLLRRFPEAHVSTRVLFVSAVACSGVRTPNTAPLVKLLGLNTGAPTAIYPRPVLDAVEAIATANEWDALHEYFVSIAALPGVERPWASRKRDEDG